MSQTGYTPISIYYSSTATNVPTAGNLVAGELALNTNDGKLFYKDSSNVVQVIGTKGGVGTSSTTQVLQNSSGLVVGSANMTFNGTTFTTANDASISGLTVGKGGSSSAIATAVGSGALAVNQSTGRNSAFGYVSLAANTSGTQNTALGDAVLNANTTGSSNAGGGYLTLLSNTTGGANTAFGANALYSNTTGGNNTAVGYQAGYNITTGTYNNILGSLDTTLTTGSYNIQIGRYANASASSVSYSLMINTDNTARTDKGSSTGFIFTGGSMYQGNNSTLWSITSDQRLKKNIVDNTDGLNKITAIQVRNFEYRLPEEVTELEPQNAIDIKGVQLGAIAQELQAILPECVKTESTGVMSVDASNITWYLVNAIQELKAEIDLLKGK